MGKYFLTAYDKKGNHLLNESFEAKDDKEAKETGQKRLLDEGYAKNPNRVVKESGALVLFHP
ncbi:YhzD family protein [Alteribacter natronophilus]|uniref:YhzD family protein n=1 Tax=Alteribacter natronophilus TaxID=2583810 RepID=UPI00110DEDA6|nr:YhzD family protein [Alteribacter natronophilus]TMW74023.1 hypothetical protein FGB90_07090 [Alteribacter natronophilus]